MRTTGTAPGNLIRAAELARRWGVSEATLYRWRMRGLIRPALTLGRSIYFALADVLRWERGPAWDEACWDITLEPWTGAQRRSIDACVQRIEVAAQAAGAAVRVLDEASEEAPPNSMQRLQHAVRAVRALIANGTDGDWPAQGLAWDQRHGASSSDLHAGGHLLGIAYSALQGLGSAESIAALRDIGPAAKARAGASLQSIEHSARQLAQAG